MGPVLKVDSLLSPLGYRVAFSQVQVKMGSNVFKIASDCIDFDLGEKQNSWGACPRTPKFSEFFLLANSHAC